MAGKTDLKASPQFGKQLYVINSPTFGLPLFGRRLLTVTGSKWLIYLSRYRHSCSSQIFLNNKPFTEGLKVEGNDFT